MEKKKGAPNWKKIKAEYIRGGISQRKLAEKYGIHRSTLQGRIQREGWDAQRKEVAAETGSKLVQKISDEQSDTIARLMQMQAESAVKAYAKILSSIDSHPDGAGIRTVREAVTMKKVEINGKEKDVPLRSTITSDLEEAVRAMAGLAKLYGLDAASILARERFEFEKAQQTGEEDGSANDNIMSIAELINHPMPDRDISETEQEGGDGDD